MLDDEAVGYETAANPALTAPGGGRRRYLTAARSLLIQIVAITEKMLRHAPSNHDWREVLADAQVRLATDQTILHLPGDANALAKAGLASFREMTQSEQASASLLDQAASAFLLVEPASLRDPSFATTCAERAVALSTWQKPYQLLNLAQAYRASGQFDKSRATAEEALSLLPSLSPGSVKPNIRKLLEIQAEPRR
jgi:tetratricopeptide (TPR) repeat protein